MKYIYVSATVHQYRKYQIYNHAYLVPMLSSNLGHIISLFKMSSTTFKGRTLLNNGGILSLKTSIVTIMTAYTRKVKVRYPHPLSCGNDITYILRVADI